MDTEVRIEQYKSLLTNLPESDARSVEVATVLEAYAALTSCTTGLLENTIPIWEYASGTILFGSDKLECHWREYVASYMERIAYIESILNIQPLKDQLLEDPRRIETFTDEFLQRQSTYGQWQDQHLHQLRRSKQILEEREETQDAFIVCKKCKSNAVDTEQKQTRSADEPMTVFCMCRKCGTRFTMK